ncbi:uncharacterized protein SPSK_01161 [Sporothrix schenckii 1099-18]|uniref:Uncharacterized protein n=1 Tax=Sporothrix schenckii 1099-18 TaxID=1397361 RepID=A0A0F2LVK6_SPOSC|nr:uncharacterized protein SPSK_01161 [Sporothrix schenckii 1099-18]KJR81492.1 hypothetical protein SPSK_01161 [Sporothrix schenckii 1099-18]
MALALHSSASDDPSPPGVETSYLLERCDGRPPFLDAFSSTHSDLTDLVAHNRHLPPSGTQRHNWQHGRSKARLTELRVAMLRDRFGDEYYNHSYSDKTQTSEAYLARHGALDVWPRKLRPHQIRLLQRCITAAPRRWHESGQFHGMYSGRGHVRGQRESVRDACLNAAYVDQARPPCPARARRTTHRPPSLERQGAFCDATTAKRRLSESDRGRGGGNPDDDLYRLGLLYDSEHACGADFGLDSIVHDAPVYSISISQGRPRGRARGRSCGPDAFHEIAEAEAEAEAASDEFGAGLAPSTDRNVDPTLPELGLSLANLADDAALARFLHDEEMTAYLAANPEGDAEVASDLHALPSTSPMHVIYELAPEVAMAADTGVYADSSCDSCSGSDAGDWVVDMDTLEPSVSECVDDADADVDNDSNPDETWLLLRP